MSWLTRMSRTLAAGLVAVAVVGCSSTEDDRASEAAAEFYAAVASQDGATACDLMTPETRSEVEESARKPCPRAVLEEDVPTVTDAVRVKVYDTMAQVRYAQDTAFLTRIGDRWRVLAVACSRQPGDHPYDCQVQGG
jgi:hypothetical protein